MSTIMDLASSAQSPQQSRLRGWALVAIGLVATVLFVFPAVLLAAGTSAGTLVQSIATANYATSGQQQAPVSSAQVGFIVDRRLDLQVQPQTNGEYVAVDVGQPAAVMTFILSNLGNGTQDVRLQALNNSQDPQGGQDNFNPLSPRGFVESGQTTGYQQNEDVLTFIDELVSDASRHVYLVGEIPANRNDGDIAALTLVGQIAVGGQANNLGAAIDSDSRSVADQADLEQSLFADPAGDLDIAGNPDTVANGQHSATGAFRVENVQVVIDKQIAAVLDPAGGQQRTPGAVVTYRLNIRADGAVPARDTVITDLVPEHTSYRSGTIQLNGVNQTDGDDLKDRSRFVDDGGRGYIEVALGDIDPDQPHEILFAVEID